MATTKPVDLTNQDSKFPEWVTPKTDRLPTAPAETGWHHVRVKAPDITGVGAEIWLDDFRVRGVQTYSVTVDYKDANKVTITLLAESVNRDAP